MSGTIDRDETSEMSDELSREETTSTGTIPKRIIDHLKKLIETATQDEMKYNNLLRENTTIWMRNCALERKIYHLTKRNETLQEALNFCSSARMFLNQGKNCHFF